MLNDERAPRGADRRWRGVWASSGQRKILIQRADIVSNQNIGIAQSNIQAGREGIRKFCKLRRKIAWI